MRAKEFITETHDAVMYKAPHMAGIGPMFGKRVILNYPGTLGRQLVSFKKTNDGTWEPNHEEAERYLDTFLDIITNEPNKVVDDSLEEMALPSDWDPTMFGHDKTFKSRVEYAKQRAPKIGGGSSRVAFIIPDNGRETVLKVAKNKKGVAQNEAEVDILTDGYVGKMDIVIPLIDYDRENPQPTWLQTELAQKASEKKLCQIMKCGALWQLAAYADNQIGNRSWGINYAKQHLETLSPEDQEIFHEYANQLADLVSSTPLKMADFGRAANWGLYNGKPVVIDLGFTDSVSELYR
jgi:hypothetical protein